MMAQQQARDEAGNIWNIDESGNPVSLAQAAPQGGPGVVAPNPVQAQRQSVDLGGAQLGNQKTAQQIALEAAKVPYAPRQAAADTTKSEAEAAAAQLALQKAQREASLPVAGQTGRANLQRAIDDIKAQFAAGPGATSGIAGLADYLPTTANQRFDAAGNAVRGFVGPALGLTGGQLNTEKEAQRAVGPYIPQSSDRDAVIQDKIQRLQGLANAMAGAKAQQGRPQGSQAMPAATTMGGAATPPNSPPGYDVSGVAGGVSGGPGGGGANFANAAGVAMAQKLSQAYNQGAGVQDLNKLLVNNGYQPFADPAAIEAITKRGPLNFSPPQADDSRGTLGRALGSAADSAGGAYAISAGDALTAGTLDNIAGGQAKLAEDYAAKQYPGATLAGQVTGGALAAGGAELGVGALGARSGVAALAPRLVNGTMEASPWIARGADALYGGAYGAGSTDDGSRLLGAAGGAAGGLVGGMAGRAIARGAGGLLTGVQNADVQGLRAAGIDNMTVGQALSQSGPVGAGIKRAEDLTTGIPGVGSVVNARRTDSIRDFNRVGFDQGLAPIGASTNGVVQETGIDAAQNAVGGGYRTALDNVNVTRDPQFTGEYASAINKGSDVARVGPEFASYAKSNLDPLLAQPSFDGRTVQDFIQQTRKADFGSDAMGDLVGKSVTDAENAMRGLVGRQAPDALPKLAKADQAFRHVEILRDAVNRARNGTQSGDTGLFVPSQLSDAAAANAKKYGNSQGTTRQPFFNLTRAAQKILPSKVGDSGSAGRLLMQGALGTAGLGAAGGGGAYATGDADGAGYGAGGALALAGLLAAGGSKTVQKLAVKSLLDRPDALIQLGNQVQRRARIGGLFGAPMLAGAGAYAGQ